MDGDVCAFQREIDSIGFPMENAPNLGRSLKSIEHPRWGVGGNDEDEVTYQVLASAQ